MKNIIFILILTVLSFANDNKNDFAEDFDSEFSKEKIEIFDPLSGYNRLMTSFNDKVYLNVLIPISKSYANNVNENARIGIDNFFNNLMFPIRFTNNILQLKFINSLDELRLFLANTLWGFLGFVNFAEELNIKIPKEDFGQTLGFYGVGEGFHVVLPFLGPSNLRDIAGISADSYVSVLSTTGSSDLQYKILNNTIEEVAIKGYNVINSTSLNPDQYETIKKDALDLYPFLRDIYSQARQKQIEE
mgnify:FL=1